MAKKVRRVRSARAQNRDKRNGIENDTDASSQQPRLSAAERFQLEYAYVLKDLRHILLLAAVMFTLLVALNIVLQ